MLVKNIFSSFHLRVYTMHMYVFVMQKYMTACLHVCMHTCVRGLCAHECSCMSRLERDSGLITLFNGAESLSQSQRPLTWLVSLTSLLGGLYASIFWG